MTVEAVGGDENQIVEIVEIFACVFPRALHTYTRPWRWGLDFFVCLCVFSLCSRRSRFRRYGLELVVLFVVGRREIEES